MDGKHSMRLQNVNVYVWTGPNTIHQRGLRITYTDFESSFSTLLENDDSVSIHVKNPQTRMIEMFKTKESINSFLWGRFSLTVLLLTVLTKSLRPQFCQQRFLR